MAINLDVAAPDNIVVEQDISEVNIVVCLHIPSWSAACQLCEYWAQHQALSYGIEVVNEMETRLSIAWPHRACEAIVLMKPK